MSANISTSTSGRVTSPKSALIALLLCFFLGAFGAHRFYVGKIKTGVLMLVTLGGLGIWALVDLVLIACGEFDDAEGRELTFARAGDPRWKFFLGIVTLLIATFILYAATVGAIIMLATSGVTDTVKAQLAAMRSGDIEKAYEYTSLDFKRETSYEVFKEFVDQIPALNDNVSSTFTTREIKNNQAFLQGTVTSEDGSVTPIEYLLIYEDNSWKILGIKINPAAPAATDESSAETDAASNEPAKPVGKLTFEDKEDKYSIDYPDNWYYEQPDKSSVMFSGKKGTQSYYSTVTIQVLPMKKSGGIYGDVKDIVADLKGQIKEKTTDVKFISEGDAELPTNPAKFKGKYFVVSYTYKGQPMKKMQFIIVRPDGKVAYSWGYTTPADQYDMDLPTSKMMYESWKME